MKNSLRIAIAGLALVAAVGCSKSSTKPVVDSGAAQQETNLGNAALASGDYATANVHYKAAIAKDPGNTHAQFGAAVTEVYLLKDDPDIQSVQNQIPLARLDPAPPAHSRIERAAVLAQRLVEMRSGVDPRYSPKPLGSAFFRTLLLAADAPDSISEVQAIIRNKVMPKLQYAEDRLNAVEAAPDFVMLIPPSVTELPDTIEIDKTEAYVLDAVINGIQGWCGLLVAYNFDVENTDFEHVNAESLLAPGTSWATLFPDGAQRLASARLDLMNVKGSIEAAAVYLAAEADDQSNDIILKSWLNTQEYIDLADGVNNVYDSLVGPVTISVNDATMQPFTLQVYMGRFFVPAITDLKPLFPALVFTTGPAIQQPITFPDPTINGIFPDMTNPRWQQLVGTSPALFRPAALRPVAVR